MKTSGIRQHWQPSRMVSWESDLVESCNVHALNLWTAQNKHILHHTLLQWLVKSKSKVDNLYTGSKRSRSLLLIAAELLTTILPLFIGPMPLACCHMWRVDMKALARYQLTLLGKQRCEQLAQGHCPTMPRPGIEPTICRSRVQHPNHYTTEPPNLPHRTPGCFSWFIL